MDRGLFPDEAVREQFPVLEPSPIEVPADLRRVRALVVDLLEEAAAEGHSLLPRRWVIRSARERTLHPPCPLGENVLDASEESFVPVVVRAVTRAGEAAYQLDRLVECRTIIRREVLGRKKGRPHAADLDWRESWTRGSMSRCLGFRKSASWGSRRSARKRRRSNSSSDRVPAC